MLSVDLMRGRDMSILKILDTGMIIFVELGDQKAQKGHQTRS